MKIIIQLLLPSMLSCVIGRVFRLYMLRSGDSKKSAQAVAAIFYGGPALAFTVVIFLDWQEQRQFESDTNYVQELCSKYGGDKIYRTMNGIEGVFQITSRPYTTDEVWRDQYGMQDPWGKAQGDSDSTLTGGGPSIPLGPNGIATGVGGYQFVEQRTATGESAMPYLRRFNRMGGGVYAYDLKSRYGYQTEDISTPDMRKRWIAGGRRKIIDLQTNELLAERVGYFRAIGKSALTHWSGASAYKQRGQVLPFSSRPLKNPFIIKLSCQCEEVLEMARPCRQKARSDPCAVAPCRRIASYSKDSFPGQCTKHFQGKIEGKINDEQQNSALCTVIYMAFKLTS